MKSARYFLSLCSVMALVLSCDRKPAHAPSIPKDAAVEKQIDRILSKMTLDDKVGQMLQINIDVLGGYTMVDGSPVWALNEEKVDTMIANYRVGSFLNAPGRAATPEQWREWIGMFNKYSVEHLGVPTLYGLDHNHGVTYSQGGTLFMQPINLGASFNVDLARQMAEVTAYESRAGNCPWVFNPVVDLGRDPPLVAYLGELRREPGRQRPDGRDRSQGISGR